MSRSYDQWKLEAPEYNDDVTSCCGSQEESTMIDDEVVSVCIECSGAYPDMIEQFEYDERMQERYSDTGEHQGIQGVLGGTKGGGMQYNTNYILHPNLINQYNLSDEQNNNARQSKEPNAQTKVQQYYVLYGVREKRGGKKANTL